MGSYVPINVAQHGCLGPVRGAASVRPNAVGWRERAGAGGSLQPDPSPVLTASEIGSFVFCKQAWFLQRCGVSVAPEAELRLAAGSGAHRAIGRRADVLRAAGTAQRVVLVAIASLALLLPVLVARGAP